MAEINVTSKNFNTEVIQSDIPVLVDFWASWCGPCRMLAPILAEIARERAGSVKVAKINVDEQEELARKFRVMSIPTIIAFKGGQAVKKTMGAITQAELKEFAQNI